MDDQVKQQLREAYALIKAKKRQEAVDILLPVLQADEENADAWWLLANCLDDPHDTREALENVLRLRPDNDKAQTMLDAINARYPRPEPEPEPDDFGVGDSASVPFTGNAFEDMAGETAAPFEGYAEAELDDDTGEVYTDPFAVDTDKRPGTGPFTEGSFSEPVDEGDPFAPADDFDPFGAAEPFGGPAEPFGGPAESFGGPVESFGGGSGIATSESFDDEDPFGDPFDEAPAAPARKPRQTAAKPAQRKARPAASKDPFAAGERVGAPARSASRASTKSKSGGTNPIVLLLAIIGGISIVACIGCGVISLAAPAILANVGGQVFQQLEMEGLMTTLEAEMGQVEGLGTNLGSAVNRGSLNYGDVQRDTLNPGAQHAWTFNGNSGDRVVVEMQSTTSDGLDAYLSLFNASGAEIAFDDDSGSEYNARLEHTLPSSGRYTIVARTFGLSGGAYQISLNRR